MFLFLLINFFIFFFIRNDNLLKILSFMFCFVYFIYIYIYMLDYIRYDFFLNGIYYFSWFNYNLKNFFNLINFNLTLYYDGLSLILIFLTIILYIVCLILSYNLKFFNLISFLLYLVLVFTIFSFITYNLFYFFIFFEIILIPMFLIIGIWGSRERRLIAAYKFFIYTVFGSVFFVIVLFFLLFKYGTTELYLLFFYTKYLNNFNQKLLWLLLFLSFSVKIPLYPFHTWLPEAHVEAPTIGSILLAGILLKLGPYGFIRFSNLLFSFGFIYFRPLIYLLCLLGLYYTSLIALRQIDLKKIIAYSSIGHMSLVILGIFSNVYEGLYGSILLMIGHGFVSGGLFLLIGLLYDKYKTRLLLYYIHLFQINPLFSIFFFFFLLANISFPLTLNFISEILILFSLLQLNIYIYILTAFSSLIVLSYNLIFYSRLFFNAKIYSFEIKFNYNFDLNIKEIFLICLFMFPIIIFGFNSVFFTYLLNKFILVNLNIILINLLSLGL